MSSVLVWTASIKRPEFRAWWADCSIFKAQQRRNYGHRNCCAFWGWSWCPIFGELQLTHLLVTLFCVCNFSVWQICHEEGYMTASELELTARADGLENSIAKHLSSIVFKMSLTDDQKNVGINAFPFMAFYSLRVVNSVGSEACLAWAWPHCWAIASLVSMDKMVATCPFIHFPNAA